MQTTATAGTAPFGAVVLLLKAVAGGGLFLLIAWIGVLFAQSWRISSFNAKHGIGGFGAVAGGWTLLLRSPAVVLILSLAFGIGFYVTARWASH